MKETLKNYFEELIKTDSAMAEVYEEKKLDDCCKYIFTQAGKLKKGNCAVVKDGVVFKWARDFMLGDIAEEDRPKANNSQIKVEVKAEEKEPIGFKAVQKQTVAEDFDELYPEEANDEQINKMPSNDTENKLHITSVIQEEPKGTITMAEVDEIRGKTKIKKEKKKEEPVDDGQLYLFDF